MILGEPAWHNCNELFGDESEEPSYQPLNCYDPDSLRIHCLWFLICRMLMVAKPLHYKRMLTKSPLHRTFFTLWTLMAAEIILILLFFRRELAPDEDCNTSNVFNVIAYYVGPTANFVLSTVFIVINYSILLFKIQKRKNQMRNLTISLSPGSAEINSQVTRATRVALGAYVVLLAPMFLVTCVAAFVNDAFYVTIIRDASFVVFFCNNLVNPFIYNFTLNDFRWRFRRLLRCQNIDSSVGRSHPAANVPVTSLRPSGHNETPRVWDTFQDWVCSKLSPDDDVCRASVEPKTQSWFSNDIVEGKQFPDDLAVTTRQLASRPLGQLDFHCRFAKKMQKKCDETFSRNEKGQHHDSIGETLFAA